MRIFLIILFIVGCKTTKDQITFTSISKGKQVGNVIEIPVEQFLKIWMYNRYPVKIDINCHELNKDEKYTYFGKMNLRLFQFKPEIFKVNNDSLKLRLGDYSKINGQTIRQNFWKSIVPEEDRNIWETTNCSTGSSNQIFTYKLQKHKIKIELQWKLKCNSKMMLKKKYIGYYDLIKKEIRKHP